MKRHAVPLLPFLALALCCPAGAAPPPACTVSATGLNFGPDVGLLRDLLIDWCRKKKVIE